VISLTQVGPGVIVRSIIFNVLFYLYLVSLVILALPTLLMPRAAIMAVGKFWARGNLWLLRVICGTSVQFRDLEKIPAGPLIVASKHQSLWETFALLPLFSDPVFIMKRELMWVPAFGWHTWKASMIPVDRSKGSQALAAMNACTARELARRRQVIIFPEGTRRAAGAEPHYRHGVVHLYLETGAPCLPIALNSGLFWPRRSFLRYPGTIVVEVLEPIPPGLSKVTFFELLQHEIETATARLVKEGKGQATQDRKQMSDAGCQSSERSANPDM